MFLSISLSRTPPPILYVQKIHHLMTVWVCLSWIYICVQGHMLSILHTQRRETAEYRTIFLYLMAKPNLQKKIIYTRKGERKKEEEEFANVTRQREYQQQL